ncbi:MAG: CPBP family intramembrane metalloprotease [Candidatus Firestonebacteria bacterium]|nr:CPBP family intramembrane metalloprotease [Candidatus Firestonebacteria bacterium]
MQYINRFINIKRALLIIIIILLLEDLSSSIFLSSNILYFNMLIKLNLIRITELLVTLFLVIFLWNGTWKDLGFKSEKITHDLKYAFYFILGLGGFVILFEVFSFILYKEDIIVYLVDYSLPIDDTKYMMLYIFTAVLGASITEEFFFRHIIYGTLRTKFNVYISIIITSIVFAYLHFTDIYYSIIPLLGGILFAVLYELTGNLIAPVILHSAGNLTLTLITIIYRK